MQARLSRGPMARNGLAAWLSGDFSAQLVVDMCADNVIKGRLRLESEIARSLCIKPLGPTGNDSLNKFVRCAANARGHFVACDTAQRVNLFAHRARHAGHRKVDAWAELFSSQPGGVNEKSHRGARARVRVADAFGNRQQCLLSRERFADDPGEEAGSSLVRFARPHADSRQPDTHTVKNAAPVIVGKQQLADRFLRAI